MSILETPFDMHADRQMGFLRPLCGRGIHPLLLSPTITHAVIKLLYRNDVFNETITVSVTDGVVTTARAARSIYTTTNPRTVLGYRNEHVHSVHNIADTLRHTVSSRLIKEPAQHPDMIFVIGGQRNRTAVQFNNLNVSNGEEGVKRRSWDLFDPRGLSPKAPAGGSIATRSSSAVAVS